MAPSRRSSASATPALGYDDSSDSEADFGVVDTLQTDNGPARRSKRVASLPTVSYRSQSLDTTLAGAEKGEESGEGEIEIDDIEDDVSVSSSDPPPPKRAKTVQKSATSRTVPDSQPDDPAISKSRHQADKQKGKGKSKQTQEEKHEIIAKKHESDVTAFRTLLAKRPEQLEEVVAAKLGRIDACGVNETECRKLEAMARDRGRVFTTFSFGNVDSSATHFVLSWEWHHFQLDPDYVDSLLLAFANCTGMDYSRKQQILLKHGFYLTALGQMTAAQKAFTAKHYKKPTALINNESYTF